MNLILTMAGKYSRFVEKGYRLPKYLMPWGDRTILDKILSNLLIDASDVKVFVIANKADDLFMPHVRSILKSKGISLEHLIMINDTSGQAETACLAVNLLESKGLIGLNEKCLFHNVDTILYGRRLGRIANMMDSCGGYIDLFESNNHGYSYVLLNEEGFIDEVKEKILISNLATSGLYGFSSAKEFLQFCDPSFQYISQIYQAMIEEGVNVRAGDVFSEKETLVLGTPEEYLAMSYLLDMA